LVDLVVIRSNAIIYSPRVRKIVKSLSKKYSILILGWNREGVPKEMIEKYISKLKLMNMRAPIGKISLIAFIPIFWIWIFVNLVKVRPKVVHACDLDTIVPCYIYRIIFRKKLVFDVCDRFAMAYVSPKLKTLYSAINSLEELFAKRSDVLITVAEKLLSTFQKRPEQTAVIMNCSEEEDIPEQKKFFYRNKEQVEEEGKEEEERGHIFTVIYTGNIVKNRGLEQITSAIKDLRDVKLIVAGKPMDKNLLHTIIESPNVDYRGLLQPVDALALNNCADAMVILYDLQIPNNNFSLSNKLFEAMMCGLPIITNVSAEIVREEVNCGTVVDYNDVNQIKAAVTSLRDNPQLCQKLGNNGRKAYLQKYNWGVMEKKLQEIYQKLV
jgi:glycosyltransferase involved in cell wall biosynthesis